MKCKTLRETQSPNPEFSWDACEASKRSGKPYDVPREFTRPPGYVIDHPDAWRLVRCGVAIPEDDECRVAADMTEEQMKAAQASYAMTVEGLQPVRARGKHDAE